MKHRFVIIDGNAILHRAWHAMPPLTTKDGRVVSAAYGFTVMLMKVMKDLKPSHLAVTFDLPGGTFRHEEFAAYKAHRVEQPDELYAQIPMVKDVLAAYGIPVYEMPGYEADDVIGTLTKPAPIAAAPDIAVGYARRHPRPAVNGPFADKLARGEIRLVLEKPKEHAMASFGLRNGTYVLTIDPDRLKTDPVQEEA